VEEIRLYRAGAIGRWCVETFIEGGEHAPQALMERENSVLRDIGERDERKP